jgi:hypothetical protein
MRGTYDGLPAAASVEQAIVLAQLLILRDLDRRARGIPERSEHDGLEEKSTSGGALPPV